MILPLGIAMLFICSLVQVFAVVALRRARVHLGPPARASFVQDIGRLGGALLVLLAAIYVQVALWAAVFVLSHEIENFRHALYFSLVNFTTLGYGDVTLSAEFELLGPMEASNGVLMMGLSASYLFTVLQEVVQSAEAKD